MPMGFEPYRFTVLKSRAVTQENPTGGKGLGGKDRGNGNCRKASPAFSNVEPGEAKLLCDIEGPGMVRHIWITVEDRSPEMMRSYVLRVYWDDSPYPSVEAPLGDFFGVAHGRTANFMTPWLGMPEGRGMQCYFPMPFSKRCKITFENDSDKVMPWLFYQIDYTLGDEVTPDMGRFHARFRRENPCPIDKDYTILKAEGSPGIYVGAVIGVNALGPCWWGEGEMKFYIDGDADYPTICGTGAEDYLCSGWGMGIHSAIYTGVNYHVLNPLNEWEQYVSFYRFHVLDPIYFQNDLKVQLQQIGNGLSFGEFWKESFGAYKEKYGWKDPHGHPGISDCYFDRSDDYCSVAYWYQRISDKPPEAFPSREERVRGLRKPEWDEFEAKARKLE